MDNNHPDLTVNETVQESHLNLEKLTQSYLLLKQKICKTHEVIKQYNDKLKECERLKTDLDAATKQTKKVTCNYNSTLAKVIKLELQNTEYKKNIETLTTQVNEYQIKTAADQQYIQQLICKIKDTDGQQNEKIMEYDLEKSSLQMKVKELEQELKNVKKSYDMKIKKMEKQISVENSNNNNNKVKMKDIGTNTIAANDEIVQQPEVADKCIMTAEFYKVKDDIYPIFCAKCEVLLEPAPLEKICNIMTKSCPRIIEQISSPSKKASPPLQISTDVNSKHWKTENLLVMSGTPSPHLQNQNNESDFMNTSLLHSHAPIGLNHANYCNNFPQSSDLMNQSSYYIGPMPVNPLLLANPNITEPNNHSKDIASSLSLISSLQKRIDTLEIKIKKKFNKRKLEESNNFWQHKHPSPCCMYNTNNSMQLNLIEMWKAMSDIYDNKAKRQFNVNKCSNKNLNKYKLSRLKPRKRLQSGCTGSWKVESVVEKIEPSPNRKRSKKCKHRHSMLLNKSNLVPNETEALDKSITDSDTDSYDVLFNDSPRINTDVRMEGKNVSRVEMSTSRSKSSNHLKTCSTQSTDIDEPGSVQAIRNSVESVKSIGGETDSGILSDSIESSKQLELDVRACSNARKCNNMIEAKSSIQNISFFTENVKSGKLRSVEKSPMKVIKSNELIDTSINSEILNSDERNDKTEDEKETEVSHFNGAISQAKSTFNNVYSTRKRIKSNELIGTSINSEILNLNEHNDKTEDEKGTKVSHFNGAISQTKSTFNNVYSTRKRKISERQDSNKRGGRKDLFTKLRNLRKNSQIKKVNQNVSNHQVQNCNHENSNIPQEQNHLVNKTESNNNDNCCIPRKRARIAHVPKSTTTKQKNSQVGKRLVKSIRNTMTSQVGADNSTKIDGNTIKQTFNEPFSAMQEIVKDDSNAALEKKCNNGVEELKPNCSIMNDTPEKVMELNEMEIESNEERESLKQENENESLSCCNNRTRDNVNEQPAEIIENSNFNEPHNLGKESFCEADFQLNHDKCNYRGSRAVSETDFEISSESIQNIIKIEHSYDSSYSFSNSKCIQSINGQKNDTKERNLNIEDAMNVCTEQLNSNAMITLTSHHPLMKLHQYISESRFQNKSCKNQFKNHLHIYSITNKFVKKQLKRLVDGDWETSVHWDVIEKLKSTCTPRIIAKGIVDLLSTLEECEKSLDNTHTPPAPLMTITQQRIVALLVDLEGSKPMIFQFVQAGIEYKLYRINQTIEKPIVESLARMYTVLARIKKDRERVRIFCCDALYCLGLNATIVLYTVFTCWPEVFPNSETSNELLPKCMAHLIMAQQAQNFPKLSALKNLVSVFYNYQMGTVSKDVLKELLTALQEKSSVEIETAIILLAKKEGTAWTYKNIIQSALLPMIINNKLPSQYRAFCLLGNLMRAFPVADNDNVVSGIVEQLCDLSKSGEGSEEQQEGIISALLSLSRHRFKNVVYTIMNWTPTAPLCTRTTVQLNGLFNSRQLDFWTCYLRKKLSLWQSRKQCKT
ncbi:uncharacterized protein LOC143340695 isoform X2 [Colletes latitarsis]|uniref:uncharacterized protein LOC143340695 isoform X2 n=1 Tax=Colletes latitarsis TaxID=2605962 RepID=UPI004036789C